MAAALCPTCGQPADPAGKEFPFCSPRCKQVDLYRWLTGDVALDEVDEPAKPLPPEVDEEDEEA